MESRTRSPSLAASVGVQDTSTLLKRWLSPSLLGLLAGNVISP